MDESQSDELTQLKALLSGLSHKLSRLEQSVLAAGGAEKESSGSSLDEGGGRLEQSASRSCGAPERAELSDNQRRYWWFHAAGLDATTHNLGLALCSRRQLHVARLRAALARVVERHPLLRAGVVTGSERPELRWQAAAGVLEAAFQLRGPCQNPSQALKEELAQPFAFDGSPLWRLLVLEAPGGTWLHLTAHHLVADAWSFGVFFDALVNAYLGDADAAAEDGPLPSWTEMHAAQASRASHEQYWAQQLRAGEPFGKLWPASGAASAASFAGETHVEELSAAQLQRLQEAAARAGVTLAALVLDTYARVLRAELGYAGAIGTMLAGRDVGHFASIGSYSRFVALLPELGEGLATEARLRSNQSRLVEALARQEVAFERVVASVGRGSARSFRAVPVAFVMQDMPAQLAQAAARLDAVVMDTDPLRERSEFELCLYVRRSQASCVLKFEYARAEVSTAQAQKLARAVLRALIAPDEELQAPAGALPAGAAESVLALIERSCRQAPEQIALMASGKTLSYADLARRTNQIAASLRQYRLEPEARIAVACRRSLDLVPCLLAVASSGCAYVPLDTSLPAERVEYMLQDCGAALLVTDSSADGAALAASSGLRRLALEDVPRSEQPASLAGPAGLNVGLPGRSSLAYVIYTSGSTGQPKGVAVEHGALVDFARNMLQRPGLSQADTVLALTTIAFDISILELIVPLCAGARVVIASEAEARQPERIAELLRDHQVTLLQATPAGWLTLLESGWTGTGLRALCGGEALSPELARSLLARCSQLWNMYGPTEATVWCSCEQVRGDAAAISLGRPLDGVRWCVRDDAGGEVPVGGVGELWIGGNCLARGYWGKPELTSSRFARSPGTGGERFYRSGDLVRVAAPDRIEFVGRVDRQIKIRGYRVELEEIERALAALPGVVHAVVVHEKHSEADQRLIACVSLRATAEPVAAERELRAGLARRLPPYMLPSRIHVLDRLPETVSGKLDRKAALRLVQQQRPEPAAAPLTRAAPAAVEHWRPGLRGIWARLLRVAEVVDDRSFFELGGHSLLLPELRKQVVELTGVRVETVDFFAHPTLQSQLELLATRAGAAAKQGHPQVAAATAPRSGELRRASARERLPADVGDRDVAVIGVGCRFPGVQSPEQFWQILAQGLDPTGRLSEARLSEWARLMPELSRSELERLGSGCFFDDVAGFDPEFFRLSMREARWLDPQQRLLLEVVYETFERAGYNPRGPSGSDVALYVGANIADYARCLEAHGGFLDAHSMSGTALSMLSGRLAFTLGLTGPNLTVDTACSSSSVALDRALQDLRAGRARLAVAAGVALVNAPQTLLNFELLGTLAPDGRCHPFDAGAHGFGQGEGAVALLLAPLSAALANGDPIWAVIKGSATNHDGNRKLGLLAPSPEAQADVIRAALRDAGLRASDVSLIEAHCPGTQLGDPIELAGLTSAYLRDEATEPVTGRSGPGRIAVGSVKASFGHLGPAAGLTGVLKGILALQHRQLPPLLRLDSPNRQMRWEETPFYLNERLRPWESNGPRRVGVTSLGYSGVNAHTILEEPGEVSGERTELRASQALPGALRIVPLSARSPAALARKVSELAAWLDRNPDLPFEDVGFTLASGREHFASRLALICDSLASLRDKLALFELRGEREGLPRHGVVSGTAPAAGCADPAVLLARLRESLPSAGQRSGAPGALTTSAMRELAEAYVAGAELPWAELFDGAARRVALPTYPFERIPCWVGPAESREPLEPVQGLFAPTWQRSPLPEPAAIESGARVLFEDAGAALSAVAAHWQERGQAVVRVQFAAEYRRLSADRFVIRCAEEADYRRLFGELAAREVVEVLHATLDAQSTRDGRALDEGCRSLFLLAKSLPASVRRLRVLTEGAQSGPGGGAVNAFASACWGVLRSVHAERPALQTQLVDISPGVRPPPVAELQALLQPIACRELVVRGAQSYRALWQPLPRPRVPAQGFRRGGVYLITGGHGTVGSFLVKRLVQTYAARVVVLARRWPGSEQRRRQLAELGDSLHVELGDVRNEADVARAVATARARFGALHGVLHLAGIEEKLPLTAKTLEGFDAVLGAKLHGARALESVLQRELAAGRISLDFVVYFSSLAAVMPSPLYVDYAAANAFLDGAAWAPGWGSTRCFSLNWGDWHARGAAPGLGSEPQPAGEAPAAGMAGFELLEAALSTRGGQLLAAQLDAALLDQLHDLRPRPVAPAGQGAVSAPVQAPAVTAAAGPERRERITRYLVEQLSAVLERPVERVHPQLPFLEQGLDSVAATKLVQRLRGYTGERFPASLFYHHATPAELARYLDEKHGALFPGASSNVDESVAGPVPWRAEQVTSGAPAANGASASVSNGASALVSNGASALVSNGASALVSNGANARADGVGSSSANGSALHAAPLVSAPSERAAAACESGVQSVQAQAPSSAREPIAVVGAAVRSFDAESLDDFWQALLDGRDLVTALGSDYFEQHGASNPAQLRAFGSRLARPHQFDAAFFRITPAEAEQLPAEQRVLLEVAWQALEHAGYAGPALELSNVGVFVGAHTDPYRLAERGVNQHSLKHSAAILANRLSYFLNAQGPSLSVDTGCSSSLVAVHLALQSLRLGECDLALVAGSRVGLSQGFSEAVAKTGASSASGKCRSFAAGADGFVHGEGTCVLVLKRARDAARDHVLGLLTGTALSHAGQSSGLVAPNPKAQARAVTAALADAGIAPSDIGYLEAHGTGTKLGDPIEIEGLCQALGAARPQSCAIGSLKTNLGHLEPASGIFGLLKALLCVQRGVLPSSLHFDQPNRSITFEATPFYVNTRNRRWAGARRAGVSAHGIGGTSAHVIVEQARVVANAGNEPSHQLLLLSARSLPALRALVERTSRHLETLPDSDFGAACYTLSVGRARLPERLALVVSSRAECLARLQAWRSAPETLAVGDVIRGRAAGRQPKVAWLFSGYSAFNPEAIELLRNTEPCFGEAFERAAQAVRRSSGTDVAPPLRRAELSSASLVVDHCTLFCLQIALAETWRHWGHEPDAVAGHSLGEYAAAVVAGAWSLEDAARLLAERARLIASLSQASADEQGATAVLGASAAQAAELLSGTRAQIAAINAPDNTVISGVESEVERVLERAQRQGLFADKLFVGAAAHSELMDPILSALELAAGSATVRAPRVPYYSSLRGTRLGAGEPLDAGYWREHLRRPVLFANTIEALASAGTEVFLEIGPHRSLSASVQRCLGERASVLPSLRRDEAPHGTLYAALASLVCRGAEPAFERVRGAWRRLRLPLPGYPFHVDAIDCSPVTQRLPSAAASSVSVPLSSGGRQNGWHAPGSHGPARNGALAPGYDGATNGAATNGGATNGGAAKGGATNGGATNGGATNGGATNGGASNGLTQIGQGNGSMLDRAMHPSAALGASTGLPIVASMSVTSARAAELHTELRQLFAEHLALRPLELDADRPLALQASAPAQLSEALDTLNLRFGLDLSERDLLVEHPTLRALTALVLRHEALAPRAPSEPLRNGSPHGSGSGAAPAAPSAPDLSPDAVRADVARLVAECMKLPLEQLSLETCLLELGADSIVLTECVETVSGRYGIELSVRDVLDGAYSVATFAEQVCRLRGESAPRPASAPIASPQPQPERLAPATAPAFAATVSTPASASPLTRLSEELQQATRTSKQRAAETRSVLADPRACAGFRPSIKEMLYPIVGRRGRGSRVWDIDGNEYIDITSGFGTLLFGHSPEFVSSAVQEQLQCGIQVGPQAEHVHEVAALLSRMVQLPRVAFCNTGTEANMTAIRLARTATRRRLVAFFEGSYHGFYDATLAVRRAGKHGECSAAPFTPGLPSTSFEDILVLRYGDPGALEELRRHGSELAAVLVEPVQSRNPELQPREFLLALRELTRELGAALIFDEVITGFRCAPGGAQQYFGVSCDIAVFGKALGGGFPIGVVAGLPQYLDCIDGGSWRYGDASVPSVERTFFAGTFNKHPLTMAVARAVLRHLDAAGPSLQARLTRATEGLVQRLNGLFAAHRTPIECVHFASMFRLKFSANVDLIFYELLRRGVYVWEGRSFFLNTAHSAADLDAVVTAFDASLTSLAQGELLPRTARPLATDAAAAVPPAAAATAPDSAGASGLHPVAAPPLVAMEPAQESWPLPPALRELWLTCQLGPAASSAYNESAFLVFDEPIDTAALTRALRALVARHDALRASFREDGSAMLVAPSLQLPVAQHDLSARQGEELAHELEEHVRAVASRPFQLSQPGLFRAEIFTLPGGRHALLLVVHHSVADGSSHGVLLEDLAKLYARECSPSLPSSSPAPRWREWTAAAAASEAQAAAHARYWQAVYAAGIPMPVLPVDLAAPKRKSYRGLHRRIDLDAQVELLRRLAAQHGATPFAMLFTAFALWLGRLTNERQIPICVPHRAQPGSLARLVSHSVTFLPILAELDLEAPLTSNLERCHRAILSGTEHPQVCLGELTRGVSSGASSAPSGLARIVFNLDGALDSVAFGASRATLSSPSSGDAAVELSLPGVPPLDLDTRSAKFDLYLNAEIARGSLLLSFEFCADLFSEALADSLPRSFEMFVRGALEQPQRAVARLPLLATDAVEGLLRSGRNPVDFPQRPPLHRWIEEQVRRTPGAPALLSSTESWSYAELDQRANAVAFRLTALGVQRGALVGVYLRRTPWLVAVILGVLKAGAAYVPLDPTYPAARLRTIVENAGVRLVVHDPGMPELALPSQVQSHELDRSALASVLRADPPGVESSPSDVAYVMYTSGSTGVPKGVQIEHASLLNLLDGLTSLLDLSAADRVLAISSYAFDISVFELLGLLVVGGGVVLASEAEAGGAHELLELARRHQVSLLQATPSRFRVLLEAGLEALPGRRFISTGEALPPQLGQKLLPLCDALWNLYGPTECTVFATALRVREPSDGIGWPLPNVEVCVVDAGLECVPCGVFGELLIGGQCLARGYLGRPELNQERFVEIAGSRWYRSGDRVRLGPDGALVYSGRLDQQVKLRGHRIELSEIESVLRGHTAVRDAVAMLRQGPDGEAFLAAYLIREPASAGPGGVPQAHEPLLLTGSALGEELLQLLRDRLPPYMVPHVLCELASFPETASGKVDRKRLPELRLGGAPGHAGEPPATELERRVAALWEELLARPISDRDQSFQDAGGHSLSAMRLLARLRDVFGREVPMSEFLAQPTVKALAARLGAAAPVSGGGVDPLHDAERLLDGIAPSAQQRRQDASASGDPCYIVTGATGFLGRHVVAQLLQTTARAIHCLVRAESPQQAQSRLERALRPLIGGGAWPEQVRAVPCDLARAQLGLSDADWSSLAAEPAIVVHLAAWVNFAYPYETLRASNVLAVRECLRLCAEGPLKPLHFASSLSVLETLQPQPGTLDESAALPAEPHQLRDAYSVSKWVAERLLERARDLGLQTVSYRLGNLSGHSRSGAWPNDDFARGLLCSILATRKLPRSGLKLQLLAVDVAARRLVERIAGGAVAPVQHLVGQQPLDSSALEHLFRACGELLGSLPYGEWRELVLALRFAPLDSFRKLLGSPGLASGESLAGPTFSSRYLAEGGGPPEEIDARMLRHCLEWLAREGLVPRSRPAEPSAPARVELNSSL